MQANAAAKPRRLPDMVREPPPKGRQLYAIRGGLHASPAKRRIYVDTSVIGGCLEPSFSKASLALFAAFRKGAATMVISDIVEKELARAPKNVREILRSMPPDHVETTVFVEGKAGILAGAYLRAGILPPGSLADARHIAVATVSRVDALVSWNFKHMANTGRIPGYNAVNLEFGYPALSIHTPDKEAQYHENRRT